MYAQIVDGQIVALGHHPDVEWDGARWWDLRDPDVREARGWLEVYEVDRPADTDTDTHDLTYELVDGQPTQVWTAREWTAGELAARTRAANEAALRAGLDAVLTRATERQAAARAIADLTNSAAATLFNGNIGRFVKDRSNEDKRRDGDIIRLARLAGNLLDSASTGDDA